MLMVCHQLDSKSRRTWRSPNPGSGPKTIAADDCCTDSGFSMMSSDDQAMGPVGEVSTAVEDGAKRKGRSVPWNRRSRSRCGGQLPRARKSPSTRASRDHPAAHRKAVDRVGKGGFGAVEAGILGGKRSSFSRAGLLACRDRVIPTRHSPPRSRRFLAAVFSVWPCEFPTSVTFGRGAAFVRRLRFNAVQKRSAL